MNRPSWLLVFLLLNMAFAVGYQTGIDDNNTGKEGRR